MSLVFFGCDSFLGLLCFLWLLQAENSYSDVLTSVPQNMTIFGDRIFKGNSVKTKSLGWALIHYDYILIRRRNLETYMYRGKTVEK